jgi:pimeloyl-ACP methyl ester carboxylesterase
VVSLAATIGVLLCACTSGRSVKPPASLVGSASANPGPPSTSATPSSDSTDNTDSTDSTDGRADPGAFASDLQWTDVTKQMTGAIGPTKNHFSFGRATMQVPLNWADTTSKKITLTVLRIRSTKQHDRLGSLVINPGGPGGSGIEAAIGLAIEELPDAIVDRFDIVGFDPRGIGLSHPLTCISNKEKDAELATEVAEPVTEAQWQATLADDRKIAGKCYSTYGSDLTYYSTTETVRDMEALRAKLGDSKLTYLGYSYGTLLGAEYASAYPDKVRALVLDGAVDPTIDAIDQDKTQAAGFQLAFAHFAANCTKKGSDCALGADPEAFVQRLLVKAAATPIPSKDAKDKRKAGDGAVLLGVISALYDQGDWPTLETALSDAAEGNSEGILALDDQYNERSDDGTYTNIEDANAAIGCADTTQRPTVTQARTLEAQWRATNPLFGGSAASSLGFCSLWKAPPDQQITVADHHAPPVLVIGTTGDPATPISGAEHLAKLLGSGQLLVWQGDGHTAYPKTSCVTTAVDSYLIELKLPAAGATCPAS